MKRFIVLIFTFLSIHSFCQVNLTESSLPIIVIDSGNEEITTDRKPATMKVYFKEDGSTNKLTDTPENYDGNIGIKLRGQTSLFIYNKNGYSVETRDEEGEDNSVNLLGMPKESDWVLHGPYGDKSLMRNALMYTMADDITPYAPRVQMVEIIVNDDYKGVYLFTEKIKRDDSRVDISKLKEDDIEGDELTGGYILKFDKADEDEIGWTSPFSVSNSQPTNFVLVYPDLEDLAPEQKTYIQEWMTSFETLLDGPSYTDEETGYRKWINTESFIDFILLNELSRNVDGYRLSTYMYKDKDSNDDELHVGPVWDYNLAFGNADYCDGSRIDGWAYDFNDVCGNDMYQVHFWWKRLLSDPTFEADLKEKWMKLRNGKFSDQNVTAWIDAFEAQLQEPQQRNFQRWDILGEYIWPNDYVGDTYDDEVNYLRQWIQDRMNWMDEEFDIELSIENTENAYFLIAPNPVEDVINLESTNKIESVNILDAQGRTVLSPGIQSSNIDVSNLRTGIYFMEVIVGNEKKIQRFVKK